MDATICERHMPPTFKKRPPRRLEPALSPTNDASVLPVHCRYSDLVDANITHNWPHLLRMINEEGFPPGIMLSRNVRAWTVPSVLDWLSSRPTARKVVPPRRHKAEAETTSTITWEGAGPGTVQEEIAFLAWQWVPLHPPEREVTSGSDPNVDQVARLVGAAFQCRVRAAMGAR